jgi:hypothetical protein
MIDLSSVRIILVIIAHLLYSIYESVVLYFYLKYQVLPPVE